MLMKVTAKRLKFRQQVMIPIPLMPTFYREFKSLSSEGHIHIKEDVH